MVRARTTALIKYWLHERVPFMVVSIKIILNLLGIIWVIVLMEIRSFLNDSAGLDSGEGMKSDYADSVFYEHIILLRKCDDWNTHPFLWSLLFLRSCCRYYFSDLLSGLIPSFKDTRYKYKYSTVISSFSLILDIRDRFQ